MPDFRPNWGVDLFSKAQTKKDSTIDRSVDRILSNKGRYQAIEKATGVPWFWIAGAHMRESNNDFRGVLHNGQRIIGTGKKTTIVPKGRGPFWSWEEAAIDALRLKKLDRVNDPTDEDIEWTLARILYEWERYNGFGYIGKTNSPYVWSYTDQYSKGKYTRDHHYDASAVDQQLGTAAVLKRLMLKDEEVKEYIESGQTKPTPPEIDPIHGVHALLDQLESLGWEAALSRKKP